MSITIYTMVEGRQAEHFYGALTDLFLSYNQRFMIGGTYAFSYYTGIQRPTKDVDFFCTSEEYPKLLQLCSEHGYQTELLDKSWIAKVHSHSLTADIIFAERNGLVRVTEEWYSRAQTGSVLGRNVQLVPVEEMIRSKAYIQSRNRFDGADVVHLILRHGKEIDWKYLYRAMGGDWELLLSYLLLFTFVYPGDKKSIPEWLFEKLIENLQKNYSHSPMQDRITRGLLLSSQYSVAIEKWGYKEVESLPSV